MRPPLFSAVCHLVDERVGAELTPAAGSELVAQLMELILGDPLNIRELPIKRVGNYTLQPERFITVLSELMPLHQEHWGETEAYRHGLQLNPDYEYVAECEARGEYILLTARREGALVGNYGLFLTRSHHTRTLIASEDTMFLQPDHRVGRLFLSFSRYGEDIARLLGASELRLTAKLENKVSEMLPRMGYRHVANQFVKIL